ncbi:MAG: DinB family protein, partial [Ktedonobacterales bacterium]
YTKEELQAYLASVRQKCHSMLIALTDEQAHRPVEYPWSGGQPVSYLELQLYTLRHVQEHAAQLSLFLGQHAIPTADLDWVARAKGDADSH